MVAIPADVGNSAKESSAVSFTKMAGDEVTGRFAQVDPANLGTDVDSWPPLVPTLLGVSTRELTRLYFSSSELAV